jgi:hypothetical protein
MSEKWEKRARRILAVSFWLSWVISAGVLSETRESDLFINFMYFILIFLIALIPCSFVSLIRNKGSVRRLLFKIPIYAFYLSIVVLVVIFIISLPFYISKDTSSVTISFALIWLATWALIMLFMLLRDRIRSWRGNRVSGSGG